MSFNLKEDVLSAVYQSSINDILNGKGLKPLPQKSGSNAQTPRFRRPAPPPAPIKPRRSPKNNGLLKMLYTFDMQAKEVYVYDISYDSAGYPLFLTYINGQWIRKSAKYFIPIGE